MKVQLAFVLVAATRFCWAFDLATYQKEYQALLTGPYTSAVSIVGINIIDYLAQSPIPKRGKQVHQVVTNLKAQVANFTAALGVTTNSSGGLRTDLDQQVENLVALGSNVESQIKANQNQLDQATVKIDSTKIQVEEAEKRVNAADASRKDAEAEYQRELQKAKDLIKYSTICHGWNHRLRLDDRIPLWQAQICDTVTYDTDKAEAAKKAAQEKFDAFLANLNDIHNQLSQYQQELSNLQQQKTRYETARTSLSSQLAAVNQARDNVNGMDKKVKSIIAHVETLFGKSQVLRFVVNHLISMDEIIIPVTAIVDEILNYTSDADNITFLKMLKQKIAADVPVIKKNLPHYPHILVAF